MVVGKGHGPMKSLVKRTISRSDQNTTMSLWPIQLGRQSSNEYEYDGIVENMVALLRWIGSDKIEKNKVRRHGYKKMWIYDNIYMYRPT